MKLTEEELKEFMKNNRPIDYGREDVDGSCNRWGSQIYEIDSKFYELATLDNKPIHAFISNKGFVDYYMLYEVERVEITEYYYKPVGEKD